MTAIKFDNAQTGDVKAGDIASGDIYKVINHIYNVTTSLEQVTKMLSDDLQMIESRLTTIESVERQHANERSALTRLITMLATESKTVSDVQELLITQMDIDASERKHRRNYLDTVLLILIVLSIFNLSMHIYRVFRVSGRHT